MMLSRLKGEANGIGTKMSGRLGRPGTEFEVNGDVDIFDDVSFFRCCASDSVGCGEDGCSFGGVGGGERIIT